MSRLDEFLRLLCGRFDNTRQLEELRRSGGPALPLAEHVNTVCNDKIDGLPCTIKYENAHYIISMERDKQAFAE